MPTAAERITRRGLETLQELQIGTFVRHSKSNGKRKLGVDASEEDDLVARMCSLETTQFEIRDEVRTKVRDEFHSVKSLMEEFIRFTKI
ncbi:hypothetical protein OROHE_007210 [Orobanche hederae]